MAARSKLGPELKRRFKAQGYSMSRVAKELGLFENSLRSWVRRNRFPEQELIQMVVFAGLPEDLQALSDAYVFEIAGERRTPARRLAKLLHTEGLELGEVLDVIGSRIQPIAKERETFDHELRLLFRAMGKNDVYACCFFDQLPREMQDAGWAAVGGDVAAALGRGAFLVYLYPGADMLASAGIAGVHRVLSTDASSRASQALVSRLTEWCAGMDLRDGEKHLVTIPCDLGMFQTPGHQYLFVTGASSGRRRPHAFVRAVLDTGVGNASLLLPLSEEVTNDFLSILLAMLKRSNHLTVIDHLLHQG